MPFFRDYFMTLLEWVLILIIFFSCTCFKHSIVWDGFNLIFLNILKGYKTLGGVLFSVLGCFSLSYYFFLYYSIINGVNINSKVLFFTDSFTIYQIVSLLKEWYNTDMVPLQIMFFFLFWKKKHIPLFVIHLFKRYNTLRLC